MGIEEQKEEREVLDSIFPEEITGMDFRWSAVSTILLTIMVDISNAAYRIAITLDVNSHEDQLIGQPTIYLSVSYPEKLFDN